MEKNSENRQEGIFKREMYKWLTPALITLVIWGGHEYYVRLDSKLNFVVDHAYKHDSAHMAMNYRIDALEKAEHDRRQSELRVMEALQLAEQQRQEDERNAFLLNEQYFTKPREVTVPKKKPKSERPKD
jgi:hypothetical protein